MIRLDLRKGITETDQYKAWKFPGGEIHFKFKGSFYNQIEIVTRLNSSDDIMFLLLVVDTIRKDYKDTIINLFIPYMPYQQADRDFGRGECFSLKTMANLINSMNFNKVKIFDSHSEVSPALITNSQVIDNSDFIRDVLYELHINSVDQEDLIILSPDGGAYKKIFHLCQKINFRGGIECCSKSRNHLTGELTIKIPSFDKNKTVLIIDDICLAGNTFLNIRENLKNKGVYLAVSHGIFNENIDKLEKEFIRVFTTNSRSDGPIGKNIEIFNIF